MLPRIPLLPKPPQNGNRKSASKQAYSIYATPQTTPRQPPGTSQSTASGSGSIYNTTSTSLLPPLQQQRGTGNNNNNNTKMSRKTTKLLADLEAASLLLEKQNQESIISSSASGGFNLNDEDANNNNNGYTTTRKLAQQLPPPKAKNVSTTTPRSVLASLINAPTSTSSSSSQKPPTKRTIVISSSRKPVSGTGSTATTTNTARRSSSSVVVANNNNINKTHRARGVGLPIDEALLHFEDKLAPFEIDELVRIQESRSTSSNFRVYFTGIDNKRKLLSVSSYDDDQSDYKTIPGDHVAYRYEILSYLGKGSFGQVVKALDHKSGSTVALKIIKNKKKFHEQAAIERHILEYLNTNHNDQQDSPADEVFVRLRDSFMFRGHCVFVFDLHGLNLYDRLKANNFASTPMFLIQQYARQLLTALDFTTRSGLVHCDLKPENVLVTKSNPCAIRLIDFGSSCFMNSRLHTYIQSRFYRAPEICLGIPYTPAIDMWSLGAMLFELYFGNPLFAVQSEADLIGQITARIGTIPQHLYDRAPRKKHFYDLENGGINRLKKTKGSYSKLQPLHHMFVSSSNTTTGQELSCLGDLISKMVRWDPAERITPAEALRHPFFNREIAMPRSLQQQLSSQQQQHQQPKTSRQHQQQGTTTTNAGPLTGRRKLVAASSFHQS